MPPLVVLIEEDPEITKVQDDSCKQATEGFSEYHYGNRDRFPVALATYIPRKYFPRLARFTSVKTRVSIPVGEKQHEEDGRGGPPTCCFEGRSLRPFLGTSKRNDAVNKLCEQAPAGGGQVERTSIRCGFGTGALYGLAFGGIWAEPDEVDIGETAVEEFSIAPTFADLRWILLPFCLCGVFLRRREVVPSDVRPYSISSGL